MEKRVFSVISGDTLDLGHCLASWFAVVQKSRCFVSRIPLSIVVLGLLMASCSPAWCDGPEDNQPDKVRRIPKLGVEVPAELAEEFEVSLTELRSKIDKLESSDDSNIRRLIPDVEIFYRAVHDALTYQEFFHERELQVARKLLQQGHDRADQLGQNDAPWTRETGLVVRGFVSDLDGSVQPYGLVIPESYDFESGPAMAVDLWFHGRGETLSELNFIQQRQSKAGVFKPDGAIVVHPYGRYSNANKFAGEVDILEALRATQNEYRVDADRIAVRGFSMGGASTWQLAVHYPGRWVAANPGAGFSETPDFLQTFQQQTLSPYWWEKKLWRWYDATEWASNLRHCPTIAYSGELDRQKQAADIMELALKRHELELIHLVGPKTQHKYEPNTAIDVESRVRKLSELGKERVPRQIDFTTYTLRYPSLAWVTIDGLYEHWEPGVFQAQITDDSILIRASGIKSFSLNFKPGEFPFRRLPDVLISSDQADGGAEASFVGSDLSEYPLQTDRSWTARFEEVDGSWQQVPRHKGLCKRPGLQGPIDDAFMGSFLFVRPTGHSLYPQVRRWADAELERAVEHWRRHFRGHVRIKDDAEVTEEDIQSHHLILWGDPDANSIWSRIRSDLPIQLTDGRWTVGDRSYDARQHAPVMIYPNPLNPERYVVTNSSFTFRDFAYLNNARQVPMLPDWAMFDLTVPAGNVWAGRVVAADFFDEQWKIKIPVPEPVKVKPPAPIVFAEVSEEER